MTSIEDKLQTLQHKVSSLDKTADTEPRVSKSYNKYIYVLLVFFVCIFVLVWLQPAFLIVEEETAHKGNVKKLNKMKTGASAAVMCGSVVGGWYWYTNKKN